MNISSLDILFISEDRNLLSPKEISALESLKFKQVYSVSDGLIEMENTRPKIVITSYQFTEQSGEEVAVRFSELILFQTSQVYLITKSSLNENKKNYLFTLGYEDIIDLEKFHSEFFSKILPNFKTLAQKAA